jgi:hypothetical protein
MHKPGGPVYTYIPRNGSGGGRRGVPLRGPLYQEAGGYRRLQWQRFTPAPLAPTAANLYATPLHIVVGVSALVDAIG